MTSKGLGVPSARRLVAMERYYLAKDLYNYNPETALTDLKGRDLQRLITEIKKRRHEKPIPTYLRKKIYYVTDPITGLSKATELQKMVSLSLQRDIQKDYSRQLVEIADRECFSEDSLGYAKANKYLQHCLQIEREKTAKAYIETDMSYLRKSKQ